MFEPQPDISVFFELHFDQGVVLPVHILVR